MAPRSRPPGGTKVDEGGRPVVDDGGRPVTLDGPTPVDDRVDPPAEAPKRTPRKRAARKRTTGRKG